jgi:polysaccharide export outer membrane protein
MELCSQGKSREDAIFGPPCESRSRVQPAASRATDEPAKTMTSLRRALLSICLLPALAAGLAQQTPVKPASGAKPAAAPAINHPATSYSTTRPAAAVSGAHSANVTANYIIGADDALSVTVWDNPNFSAANLPVRPDGKITLPMIGDIQASGFTPMQLSADITTRLKQFIIDPVTVNVSVLAVNSKRVYLIGEIMHVGPLAITPGMTVLQAIATAGGLTPYANKKHIYILRGDRQQKIPFDYSLAIKKGDMQGVSLVPGDTIVVP